MGHLAILWHLHQPDYRDPTTGRPVMPWTRLHALRGYRDLAVETVRDEVSVTLNLVPSLLDQLLWYAGGGDDDHLALTRTPAADLSALERDQVRRTFVCGNGAMIRCQPAYHQLAVRNQHATSLSKADLQDLQVWSTLAWFGATALHDHPELVALREKGQGFDASDKAVMLAAQAQILADLPLQLAALRDSPASLSTTPYFHPILPLVINNAHAQRCMPGVPDMGFAWASDARLQLTRARERYEEVLGIRPQGCWPSEGSVSPEAVELIRDAGFSWFATDEGVLARSQRTAGPNNGSWDVSGVRGFFRDRDLSDRIGFDYARRDPQEAATELLMTAAKRAGDGVITIALDGENPWEAFPDAGAAFRTALHRGLREGPVRGITFDTAATLPSVGRIGRIHTGSWINADFGIWYGHEEDRTAWRMLAEARAAAEADPERGPAAIEALLPAEGSDWMWWYGDEFSTPFSGTFDALFRAHVRAAWAALGRAHPEELDRPIKAPDAPRVTPPLRLLDIGDERALLWASWLGAGVIRFPQGAMAHGRRLLTELRYGWSESGTLWVRLDLDPDLGGRWELLSGGQRVSPVAQDPSGVVLRCDGLPRGSTISLQLQHHGDEDAVTTLPEGEPLQLDVPQSASRDHWFV